MAKAKGLTEKHFKALQLLADGGMKKADVAKEVGFSADHLYDLIEGKPSLAPVSTQFKAELNKIKAETNKDIRVLTKANKKIALRLLNQRLQMLESTKKKLTNSREVTTILNALNKATPNVEIDQLNQFNSMTPEEIAVEFKRLQSVAREFNRGRIPQSAKSGTGNLPDAISKRHRLLSESADQEL